MTRPTHCTLEGYVPHRAVLALAAGLTVAAGATPAAAWTQTPTPARAMSLEEIAAGAMRAVVFIDVQTPSDTRQGSGFLVDPTDGFSPTSTSSATRAVRASSYRPVMCTIACRF